MVLSLLTKYYNPALKLHAHNLNNPCPTCTHLELPLPRAFDSLALIPVGPPDDRENRL